MFLQDLTMDEVIDCQELESFWRSAVDSILDGDPEEAQGIFLMSFLGIESPEMEERLQTRMRQYLWENSSARQALDDTNGALALARFVREMFPDDINCLFQLIVMAIRCQGLELEILTKNNLLELLANSPAEQIDRPLMHQSIASLLRVLSAANIDFITEDFVLAWARLILEKSTDPLDTVFLLVGSAFDLGEHQGLPSLRLALLEICLEFCDDPDLVFDLSCQIVLAATKARAYSKAIELAKECCGLSARRSLGDRLRASYGLFAVLMEAGQWQQIPAAAQQHSANLEDFIRSHPRGKAVDNLGLLLSASNSLSYLTDSPKQLHETRNQMGAICSEIVRLRIGAQQELSHDLGQPEPSKKILRIGYIASTLGRHSVGWLSRGLFAHHDRQSFQVFLYNINRNPEEPFHRQHFANNAFASYYFGSDVAGIVQQIQSDKIDILIDLDSLTLTTTYEVMCCKPAPIQVTWLGWDASGCPEVDYFIADPYVLPADAEEYYHSKIWRLPQTYIAVDGFEMGVPTKRRSDYGIPEDAIVYLCIQKSLKHNPDILRLQMQIVKAVPNSYLLVRRSGDDDAFINTYRQVSAEVGISMDRLRFLDREPDEYTHRANLGIADVVLDTFPYNGATTTLETLWAGVPMVTKVGQSFVARNSYSFMTNVGVTEGIAYDDEEYVAWGIELGTNSQLRQQVSGKLFQSRKTSHLWDARGFALEMENAYHQMWDVYQGDSTAEIAKHHATETSSSLGTVQQSQALVTMNNDRDRSQPLRVDLGCDIWKQPGFIGVDIAPGEGVDIVADLNQKFPFADSSIDEVKAHDVIEHLQDRLHTMNEIWRTCKPGAIVDIRVPSTDGRGAFQDPTHVSFWNINSFMYYAQEFPAYLELSRRYGFQGEFRILNLEQEEAPGQVIHVSAKLQVVKPWSNTVQPTVKHPETVEVIEDELDSLIDAISLDIKRYQDQPDKAALATLREHRYQVSQKYLRLTDSAVFDSHSSKLGNAHQLLMASGVKKEPLTQAENQLINEALGESSLTIQQILVLMLYANADSLPLETDLSFIPEWFLPDYLRFILSVPISFHELGSADRHRQYLCKWMSYLHEFISQNPTDSFWQTVANTTARFTNCIGAYFNDENLKDFYIKRASIVESYLANNGHEIDHEFGARPINRKKIRLGIIASHFTASAETFATLPIYEYLSRDFEVILYTLSYQGLALEAYCRSCANHLQLLPSDLLEQVRMIRGNDLDVLLFATNITAMTNQMCLLATHRLARVQVASSGSVTTTGLRNMDYFISGTLTDSSPTAQEQYREKLIRLAGVAHCFSYGDSESLSVSVNIVNRENLGISQDATVFISGANFFKIIPELIHTWAKIIAEVPNAIMLLLPYGPNWSSQYPKQDFAENIVAIFSQYNIAADRLIIVDPHPVPNREEVKTYYQIADICLDSYPFSGTTSLVEPLQVGLPVVTRQGNSFRSAMGAAMIQSLGVSGLVANSEESYIQLAIALGNSPILCQQKAAEIQLAMDNNPSFLDSKAYSAQMEELFKGFVRKYSTDYLKLGDVNLIVCPDWEQSEEMVGSELQAVMRNLAARNDSRKTTLLIDTDNIDIEDAEMFLSGIAMNLMLEEDLDIMETIEISLIDNLDDIAWQELAPRINARVILACDNPKSIKKLSSQQLMQCQIDAFDLN
jgi:predicted O-linked N-acetylglucosamine transferase (SPINDLY family)/SAM-dependent methyltransferase